MAKQSTRRQTKADLLASTIVQENTDDHTIPPLADGIEATGGTVHNFTVAAMRPEFAAILETGRNLDIDVDKNGQRLIVLVGKAYGVYVQANANDTPSIREMVDEKRNITKAGSDFFSTLRKDILGDAPPTTSMETLSNDKLSVADRYRADVAALRRALQCYIAIMWHGGTGDAPLWDDKLKVCNAPTAAFLPAHVADKEKPWTFYVPDPTDPMPLVMPLNGSHFARHRYEGGSLVPKTGKFNASQLKAAFWTTPGALSPAAQKAEAARVKAEAEAKAKADGTDGDTKGADQNDGEQMLSEDRRKALKGCDVLTLLHYIDPLMKADMGPSLTLEMLDGDAQAMNALRNLHLAYLRLAAEAQARVNVVPSPTVAPRKDVPLAIHTTSTVVPLSVPTKAEPKTPPAAVPVPKRNRARR